jgi:hypothetical protein
MDDLDVDFANGDPGELTTELLARCTAGAERDGLERDFLRRMPVGMRLRGLVLLCMLGGKESFAWTTTCAYDGCGKMIDIELPLRALVATDSVGSSSIVDVSSLDGDVRVRLPTEDDIRRWRDNQAHPSEMLLDLVESESREAVCSNFLVAVEEALLEADPLVAAEISSRCPFCGEALALEVDVEAHALTALAREQQELFQEISTLASVFHWSEQHIFEMPRDRRCRYLSEIEGRMS